jgi:Mlc titration factor MtfA (ptsG expression regulator)
LSDDETKSGEMVVDGSAAGGVALGTQWERWTLRRARAAAVMSTVVLAVVGVAVRPFMMAPPFVVVLAGGVGYVVYDLMTRKLRRRRTLLAVPFPAEWEAVLQRDVVFYQALDASEQARFRREVQVFIGEKLITGIQTEIDATTRVLTASSAVIPIFGFSEWEWDQINEVLIYATRFDEGYGTGDSVDHQILGMVGTGMMNRLMILSKPDLIQGFRNSADKSNVGVHEFAHLVDKSDGVIDGLPAVGLDRQAVGPWIELVRRKMQEIQDGDSDIRAYGGTSEVEFFAVASEYFFERPGLMQDKHPDLYAMLARVFAQDLATRVSAMTRARKLSGRSLGRNSRCPCGSGKKFRKCCRKLPG